MRKIYGYVYLIRNSVNGKCYVGQTTATVARRWRAHQSNARNCNMVMARALRKYGPDSFAVVELGRAFSASELDDMEIRAIWSHESDCSEFGYNTKPGGASSRHSPETRRKISEAQRGRKLSAEWRANLSAAKMGSNHMNAEARAKVSAALKGKPLSEETKLKMSAVRKGRPKSDQHRAAISAGLKASGWKPSTEHVAKFSAAGLAARWSRHRARIAEQVEHEI